MIVFLLRREIWSIAECIFVETTHGWHPSVPKHNAEIDRWSFSGCWNDLLVETSWFQTKERLLIAAKRKKSARNCSRVSLLKAGKRNRIGIVQGVLALRDWTAKIFPRSWTNFKVSKHKSFQNMKKSIFGRWTGRFRERSADSGAPDCRRHQGLWAGSYHSVESGALTWNLQMR